MLLPHADSVLPDTSLVLSINYRVTRSVQRQIQVKAPTTVEQLLRCMQLCLDLTSDTSSGARISARCYQSSPRSQRIILYKWGDMSQRFFRSEPCHTKESSRCLEKTVEQFQRLQCDRRRQCGRLNERRLQYKNRIKEDSGFCPLTATETIFLSNAGLLYVMVKANKTLSKLQLTAEVLMV